MYATAALLAMASMASGLPTKADVDWARVRRIHECFGDEGMVHCNRFERLKCAFVDREQQLARCEYREWSDRRQWPRKTIVLKRAGENWEWVSGDSPRCSIMVISDE